MSGSFNRTTTAIAFLVSTVCGMAYYLRRTRADLSAIQMIQHDHGVRKANREFWLIRVVPTASATAVAIVTMGALLHWF